MKILVYNGKKQLVNLKILIYWSKMQKSFYECFRSISDNALLEHIEDINEATLYLTKIKEEDPLSYIFNLIEIIETTEIPIKTRVNAIKMITVPLQRQSAKIRRIPDGLNPETFVSPVFNTLSKYLAVTEEEMDVFSVNSFIIYLNSIPSEYAYNVICELISRILPDSPVKFVTRILQIISEANVSAFPLQARIEICAHLNQANSKFESDECRHYYLQSIERLIHYTDLHEVPDDFVISLINLVWENAQDFPLESSKLFTSICYAVPEIFRKYPENYERYLACLTSSINMWPFLSLNTTFYLTDISNTILKQNWQIILQYCIELLVSENSTEPLDNDDIYQESNRIVSGIQMIDLIIETQFPNAFPLCMEYISNNLKSDNPAIRFVCSVFASKLSHKMNDEATSQILTQQDLEARQEVLMSLLQDDSPRVLQQALNEATELIEIKVMEPTDELFEFALQLLQSEKSVLSDCAQQVLSAIANSGRPGAVDLVSQHMVHIITESEPKQVDLVSESFFVLTSIAANLDSETSLGLIDSILEYTSTIINSNIPTISACIGYLCQLIRSSGESCAPYLEQFNALAIFLISNNSEDDGYLLLSAMIDVFGANVMQVIEECMEVVQNNLAAANNSTNLISILTVVESVSPFITDQNDFMRIVESCVEHLSSSMFSSASKLKIGPVFSKIAQHCPDAIAAHAPDILALSKNLLTYIVSRYNKAMQLVLVLAYAMPDNCEDVNLMNLLLQQLRAVSREKTKFDVDKKELTMSILNLLSTKVPQRISTTQFTLSSPLYKNLEQIVGPEHIEALHNLLPKYEPDQTPSA